MFCTRCGKEISEQDNFCRNCGAPVHDSTGFQAQPMQPVQQGTIQQKRGSSGMGGSELIASLCVLLIAIMVFIIGISMVSVIRSVATTLIIIAVIIIIVIGCILCCASGGADCVCS